ncbi:thioredoxin 1 [Ruminiclostridium sufflavum DSM 19573]|uniref:Thioredoxin n=2 Tax=Ruminiclostridium TaxID=1508657 RepID=A0A318Y1F5_9FIRM|nr:thioredoxin 1 [Ruminiclostridium sufflavum DSM 19573]
MPVRITENNFKQEILQSRIPVLVEFFTDGCVTCKKFSPLLAEIEEEFKGRVRVYKINANINEKLVAEYTILSAPSLLFFSSGKEIERKTGIYAKEQIAETLNKILEESK